MSINTNNNYSKKVFCFYFVFIFSIFIKLQSNFWNSTFTYINIQQQKQRIQKDFIDSFI